MSSSIRIVEMPDLGSVTDATSFVGERSGSGRFSATALRNYVSGGTSAGVANVRDFGAVGNGVTDDSAAIQATVNAAIARKTSVYVPAATAGYLVNTPINIANTNGVTIYGDAYTTAASFDWVAVGPTSGSTLIGNTGSGRPVLDGTGATALVLRDFSINALPAANPSTIGIILGTSSSTTAAGHPGGSGVMVERVGIFLQNANASVPIYGNNVNLSTFISVGTIGIYGLMLVSNNPLGVTPPFASFGPVINSDGNTVISCSLLGYGGASPLYLEGCNSSSFHQVYIDTIQGGPSFSGTPFGMLIKDCADVKMKIECDYFPTLAIFEGDVDNLDLAGVIFPWNTPTAASLPLVGYFFGTSITNCRFAVKTFNASAANYHYASPSGTTPTMSRITNCDFLFDSAASTKLAYFNVSSASAVPIFNLRFNGNTDTMTTTMTVADVAMPTSKQRYWINGTKFGTA